MLFKEYMTNVLGLSIPMQGRDDRPGSLHFIGQFEFGQYYSAVLTSGVRVNFSDFHVMLEVIRDEFLAQDMYAYRVFFSGGRYIPKTGEDTRVLVIQPRNEMGRVWGRNIKKLMENLTMWVTEYNLSDRWSDELLAYIRTFPPSGDPWAKS